MFSMLNRLSIYLRAKLVKVTTEAPQIVALDGEIVGTTPVEILSIPSGLTVIVPKQLADKA
jgi:diacylglycerol kinase family enzyme